MDTLHALYIDQPVHSRSRWLGSLLLFPLCVYFCIKQAAPTVLDTVAYMVHAAGGFLFSDFGGLWPYTGGPLLQVLLPGALIGLFYLHGFCFGVQVFLFWLGQNLMHIGFCIRDAVQAGQVPSGSLAQGWHTLLEQVQLLDDGLFVGFCFYMLGALCFFTLLVLPRTMSR